MSRTLKLIFAAFLFAGFALIGISSTQAKQDQVKTKDQLISGTPLSAANKKHLMEDNFVLVKTVAAMPLLVQKKILRSGGRNSMADAGQPFEITDAEGPKPLPFRRLVFAGTSLGYCVVYNEYGGIAYGTKVSLYRLSGTSAILVWRAYLLQDGRKLLDLQQLRDAIDKGKYRSEQLPKQPEAF